MLSFFKKTNASNGDQKGRAWIILGIAAIGVLLLLFGSGEKKSTVETTALTNVTAREEMEAYQSYLEGRVKELCQSVSEVGNVTVIVTLAGDFETVYATEQNANGEEYVILGSGSSASALCLTHKAPEIGGIGIVCSGGDSIAVRGELISLISASFDVPTNRIYVTQAKK